jgi:hypothetical protein
MAADSLHEMLLHVRKLLLDLERHLDRAAEGGELTEVGRAWARAAQVEELLRAAVPAETREVAKVEEGPHARF